VTTKLPAGGEPRFRMAVPPRPEAVEPAAGWTLVWTDLAAGIGRLTDGERHETVVVDGSGTDWFVTLRGRRIAVAVRTRREEALSAAAEASATHDGPLDIRASLPGLVVVIQAAEGSLVAAGDPLLRLEAMKMQNEVRAPRAGRVTAVLVEAGRTVATGDVLLRLE
jgi:biotin carboxyl carrier protein